MRNYVFALALGCAALHRAGVRGPCVYVQSEASFTAGLPDVKNDFEARQLQIGNGAFMAFRPA
jgi:hypothetical protein